MRLAWPLYVLGAVLCVAGFLGYKIVTSTYAEGREQEALYQHCIRDGHPDYECYRDTHPGAR